MVAKGLLLALLALVVMAVPVMAAAPPVVIHAEQTEAFANVGLPIIATVSAEAGVERVEVFFRAQGTKDYYRMLLRGQSYAMTAMIPGSLVNGAVLEYYIEARDKEGQVSRVGNADNPIQVTIKSDTSAPELDLLNPAKDDAVIALSHNVLVVAFNDSAGNVDTSSVKVYWDKHDVTKRAVVSPTAVSLVIPEELKEGRHYFQVKVADTAGNESASPQWRFIAKKQVIRHFTISGGLSGAYKFDGKKQEFSPEWKSSLKLGYGEWGAAVDVSYDDPLFTKKPGQPTNKVSLVFDGTWLDVNALDLKTSFNDLLAKDYAMRGGDISLNTFLGLRLAAGQSVAPVAADAGASVTGSFGRYMLGFRPSLNIGKSFTTGLDVAVIADSYDESLGVDSKPEYSLGLGVDSDLKLFGGNVALSADGAVSVYFDNARKMLEINGTTYPIPDPIASPPRLDSAMKVGMETPLPWSKLTAEYVHTGPNYKTLGVSVSPDEKGYTVNWETSKWFGALTLGATYSKIDSNIKGPLDVGKIVTDILAQVGMDLGGGGDGSGDSSEAATPVETTITQKGKMKLAPKNWPSIEVKVENSDVTEPAQGDAEGQQNTTQSIAVDVGNMKMRMFGGDFKLGLGLATSNYTDALAPDQTNDKVSNNIKLSTSLTKGVFTYGTVTALKLETDLNGSAADLTATSPSVEVSMEIKPFKSLSLKTAARMDTVKNNATVASDQTNNRKLSVEGNITWKLGSWLKLSAEAEQVMYSDLIDSSKDFDELKAAVGGAITF